MEQYANSLIRNRRKLGHEIASDHDNSEQVRELKDLQRNLANRIRRMQRRTRNGQPSETA